MDELERIRALGRERARKFRERRRENSPAMEVGPTEPESNVMSPENNVMPGVTPAPLEDRRRDISALVRNLAAAKSEQGRPLSEKEKAQVFVRQATAMGRAEFNAQLWEAVREAPEEFRDDAMAYANRLWNQGQRDVTLILAILQEARARNVSNLWAYFNPAGEAYAIRRNQHNISLAEQEMAHYRETAH